MPSRFIRLLPGLLAVGLMLLMNPGTVAFAADSTTVEKRPNIVLIMTDDQHYDSLRYMPQVLKRLAPDSVEFTQAYVTTPNCCPARAGFLTGRYNHGHGVLTNGGSHGGASAYRPKMDVAEELMAAGYRTGIFGKWLTNVREKVTKQPRGFEDYLSFVDFPEKAVKRKANWRIDHNYYDWHAISPAGLEYFGNKPEDYSTDVFLDRALKFLDSTDERPFFLQYSPFAPHAPAVTAQRHKSIDPETIEIVKSPAYGKAIENTRWGESLNWRQWNDKIPELDARTRKAVLSLLPVDEAVGQLLDQLKRIDKLDNTVIIFTSDNGYSIGEHRWYQKLCPYDDCMRVPMLMKVPHGILSANVEPGKNHNLITNLDVAKLLLEFAKSPAEIKAKDGVSLLPTLADAATPVRERFYTEMYGTGGRLPKGLMPWQGVRTIDRKLVRFSDGSIELFDLANDPWELINVADDPAFAADVSRLRAAVDSALEFRVERQVETLKPVAEQCSAESGVLEFALDRQMVADGNRRFTSVALEFDFAYGISKFPKKDFVIEIGSQKRSRWQVLTGVKGELLRRENKIQMVMRLNKSLQRFFGEGGFRLKVKYPRVNYLAPLCTEPPRVRFDIVTDRTQK